VECDDVKIMDEGSSWENGFSSFTPVDSTSATLRVTQVNCAKLSGNRRAGVGLEAIASACWKDHRLVDERSLAMGAAIARGQEDQPSWIPHAQQTLERWLATADPRVRPALLEWQALLSGPVDDLIVVLTRPDGRSMRLRQSNPLAGVLPISERNGILRRFARHGSVST
jgi:hypothetical protein